MAKTSKAAAPAKKGAAAVAEKKPEPKTVEVRGLELTLPDTLPATFAFDVAEMQQEATVFAVIRLLTTFLGSYQVVEIRGKVARGEVTDEELGDFLGEILEAIFEEFGLSLGEAEASQMS